jgi:hypothetical protein
LRIVEGKLAAEKRLHVAMAGTGGGGSGFGGGDNNEERLRKMIVDHLRASKLSAIDTRTPEGLASLTAILGQALQAGLIAGEAHRDEEARKVQKPREQRRREREMREQQQEFSHLELSKRKGGRMKGMPSERISST